MVTDQEIAALREDIAQGRPWIPEWWRDEDRWVTRPVPASPRLENKMASERNWTPEPWDETEHYDGDLYIVPHDDYQRSRACVDKLADFPNLDECVVLSKAGLKAWGGLCQDMADALKQAADEGATTRKAQGA